MVNDAFATADEELASFLAPYLRTTQPRYRFARWLKCHFNASKWQIESSSPFEINWDVLLDDGELLTAPRHSSLWEALRCWLIVQTHVDVTGSVLVAPETERQSIQLAVHCIDYFLLRSEMFALSRHGLCSLTTNDLIAMLANVASNRSCLSTVYQWPTRLATFLRTKIDSLTREQFEQAILEVPRLGNDIPVEADRLTNLSDQEILAARAWLHCQHLLKAGKSDFRLRPDVPALAELIYPSSIGKRIVSFWVPKELCIGPGHRVVTEYPRARVVSERDERLSSATLRRFVKAVGNLSLLRAEGLSAPQVQPDDLSRAVAAFDVKPSGRFRTLPHEVVFGSLRVAIEFALEYGDGLVDSYLAVCKAASEAEKSIGTFLKTNDLAPHLAESSLRLGVRRWSIDLIGGGIDASQNFAEYHRLLRSNVGLWECLRVLYGATQITVGALMARRQSELVDLCAGNCLDTTRSRLVFRNRKSGIGGMRDLEARPIPPVAVRLISMLERLQDGLLLLGAIPENAQLFSTPRKFGEFSARNCLVKCGMVQFYDSVDYFCDWAQTPLDSRGNRYYIRQHQLRRFFAMLFFYGGGFGGMETLRWFLGHTDAEHLWHYITEFTPGETIRSVAAEWAAYGVRHGTREAELLGAELTQHFGTSDFSVLEEEALLLYIEDLMEEGRLSIEPEFLDRGGKYRIAVVLHPMAQPT